MTNITFTKKEFEKHIKLSPEIIEKISLFGTPLERIDEKEIEIEIFPNRPDLISLEGYVRGFKAFIGKEKGLKKYPVHKPQKNYKVKISSNVKEIRPFTACAIIKGLRLDDEKIKQIIDLQEKLHITIGRNRKRAAIGIYPLEKIKLPIIYDAKKPSDIKFTPLESKREMNGNQILTQHPAGKTYSKLLKGEKFYPVLIDSNNEILSMPPIINSQKTGRITTETKDVFIECSGHDLETLKKVLNIITTTFAEFGASIYQMELEYGNKKIITPNFTPEKIKISLEKLNKLLGLEIKEKELEKLLSRMGYDYQNKTILIPAWRTDILHEVDIIEDVAIAYGYDKLVPEIPSISSSGEETSKSKIKSKIS